MKTTALALALVFLAPLSLPAASLKGSFLLSADSTVSLTKMMSFSKGHASLTSESQDSFRVNADEITLDQSELTLEIDGRADIYRLNPAGIVVSSPSSKMTPGPDKPFSTSLPKLDLSLRATTAPR